MTSKKILILGGTQFVGRHLTEQLSHNTDLELTLFHRGKTNPDLFPQLQHILGDRNSDDIERVMRQDWDAVVDFSCYYPQPLQTLTQALTGRVGRYLFVSSISVYDLEAFDSQTLISEASQTVVCSAEEETDTSMVTYGKRKKACEQVLLQNTELNAIVFRPGLIYGPYDPTDRAYYWLWRQQQAQAFLVAEPHFKHQWTFAADFAQILALALLGQQPAHNLYLALTHEALDFQAILAAMAKACGTEAKQISVNTEWMTAQGLQFWQDLPLSLPFERLFDRTRLLDDFPINACSFDKSWQISRDYYTALGWPEPKTGLSYEQEQTLLQALDI